MDLWQLHDRGSDDYTLPIVLQALMAEKPQNMTSIPAATPGTFTSDDETQWFIAYMANTLPLMPMSHIHQATHASKTMHAAWELIQTPCVQLRHARKQKPLPIGGVMSPGFMAEAHALTKAAAAADRLHQLASAAAAAGDVVTCNVCMDDVPTPLAIACGNEHWVCRTCAATYISTELYSNGRAMSKCVQPGCTSMYTDACLADVLPARTYRAFVQMQTRAALRDVALCDEGELTHTCPCGDMAVLSRLNTVHTCASCGVATCVLCDKPAHVPRRCSEVGGDAEEAARREVEEAMTAALVRRCACGAPIVKTDGCNKMTCSLCGKFMCYLCGVQIEGYSHFCNCGTSGCTCGKCQVHERPDDDRRVAAAAAQRVAAVGFRLSETTANDLLRSVGASVDKTG